MGRIFLSHSSVDNATAIALRDWLVSEGFDDLFLDLDPDRGISPGERWERALYTAADRCEAVIFLVSKAWLASDWCFREFDLAAKLNKRMFGVLIEDIDMKSLPARVKRTWQLVNLAGGGDQRMFRTALPGSDQEVHVTFSKDELRRLRTGLTKAGLDARFFAWPPENDPDRPPYRGLRPLEAEDAGIFYGREAPIVAVLDRLRGLSEEAPPRFLAILGASGAGKSSFLRAGLIPRLARDDRNYVVLPIIRPARSVLWGETGLAASLAEALKRQEIAHTRAEVEAAIKSGAPRVESLLKSLAEKARPPKLGKDDAPEAPVLILAVDQAEELFLSEGAEEAKVFLGVLKPLLLSPAVRLIVLATIRSDSYEQLQTEPALDDIRQQTFSLPPLPKGSYQTVIEGPAQRLKDSKRTLRIDPALTAALLSDIETGETKDALPLLAFTLERLYAQHGADGDLTLREYEEFGRLGGAINAAVERALAAASEDRSVPRERDAQEALMRRAFIPWLASIDPQTNVRRRVARMAEIPSEAQPIIRHLVEQRLLSTNTERESGQGERTVEPAHEALFRQWNLLKTWLAEDQVALTSLEDVKGASRDWIAHDRNEAWLTHSAGRLEDAERYAGDARFARFLGDDERGYLAQARQVDTQRRNKELDAQKTITRRTRVGAIAAGILAAIAVGAAVFGLYGFNEAREQQLVATEQARAAETQAEEAKRQAAIAEEQKQEAVKQTEIANAKTKEADEQRKIAEQQTEEAKRQAAIAEEKTREAEAQTEIANENAREAEKQRQEAQKQQQIAEENALYLSSSAAASLVDGGNTDGALLTLNKVAKNARTETARDSLYTALFRSLSAAQGVERYKVPPHRAAMLHKGELFFESPDGGTVQRLMPDTGVIGAVTSLKPEESLKKVLDVGGSTYVVVGAPASLRIFAQAKDGAFRPDVEFTYKLRDKLKYELAFTLIEVVDKAIVLSTFFSVPDNDEGSGTYFVAIEPESGRVIDDHRVGFTAPLLADGKVIYDGASDQYIVVNASLPSLLGKTQKDARLSERAFMQQCTPKGELAPEATDQLKGLWGRIADQSVTTWQCTPLGNSMILTEEMATSGGGTREDNVLYADGNMQPLSNVLGMDRSLFPTDLVASADKSSIAIAQGRKIYFASMKGEDQRLVTFARSVQSTPDQIAFDDKGRIWAYFSGRGEMMVLDANQVTDAWHPAVPSEIESEQNPSPLHPGTCSDFTFSADRRGQVELNGKVLLEFKQAPGEESAESSMNGYAFTRDGVTTSVQLPYGCFSLSPDARKIVLVPNDESYILIQNVDDILARGGMAKEIGDVIPMESSTAFFLGGDLIVTSSNRVLRLERGNDGSWQRREIYQGDYRLASAEPNHDGSLLLIQEIHDESVLAAFAYSVRAQKNLLAIGGGYKYMASSFTTDEKIFADDRNVRVLLKMPEFSDLIEKIPGALSAFCKVVADDVENSPCWPGNRAE